MGRVSQIAQVSDTGTPVHLYLLDLGPIGLPVHHLTLGSMDGGAAARRAAASTE